MKRVRRFALHPAPLGRRAAIRHGVAIFPIASHRRTVNFLQSPIILMLVRRQSIGKLGIAAAPVLHPLTLCCNYAEMTLGDVGAALVAALGQPAGLPLRLRRN
jgi:hypothetical protein